MKKYKATGIVSLSSGRVRIDSEQAKRRMHAMTVVDEKKGIYELKSRVHFKVGETFGYDGEIPKGIAAALVDAKGKNVRDEMVKAKHEGTPRSSADDKAKVKVRDGADTGSDDPNGTGGDDESDPDASPDNSSEGADNPELKGGDDDNDAATNGESPEVGQHL